MATPITKSEYSKTKSVDMFSRAGRIPHHWELSATEKFKRFIKQPLTLEQKREVKI